MVLVYYLRNMIGAAMCADEYWYLHLSYYRNIIMCAHTTLSTVPI